MKKSLVTRPDNIPADDPKKVFVQNRAVIVCPQCEHEIGPQDRILTPTITKITCYHTGNSIQAVCPNCGAGWLGSTVIEFGAEHCVDIERIEHAQLINAIKAKIASKKGEIQLRVA